MKLLVAISQTPETTARIAFKNEGTTFDNNGVNFIINPYDEWYALVRAIELKEQNGGTVTVIHCGPAANEVNIRKALAIGADDAIRDSGHEGIVKRSHWQISNRHLSKLQLVGTEYF